GGVILLILSLLFGRDFISDVGGGDQTQQQQQQQKDQTSGGEVGAPVKETPDEHKEVQFVSWVLDTTQATWSRLMPEQLGGQWHDAKLVLYRDATQTRCGVGQAGMGPFYCPLDERVYIDLAY